MNRLFLTLALVLASTLCAQQPVAPTPEPVGPARGDNVSEYNIVNSFETGYRFSSIDGNEGKYRSDVNYGNGLRLLASNFTINSRDGRGRFFDEIVLTTLGLGNDPYESAVLRVQKNGLYRYDMQWRLDDYYNPALTISQGQHLYDTSRRLQDHDLTLFPQAKIRFRVGYSRNSQTGPALNTTNVFDITGDVFPLFTNVRRLDNEYRLGGDLDIAGIKITWLHRWEDFKEDTPFAFNGPSGGNNPTDLTTLSSFQRTAPYHGTTPGWLANLHTDRKKWAANGRFTYAGGRRDYILDETAIGTNSIGLNQSRQIVVGGDASRPVTTGDLSVTVLPTQRLSIVNNSSLYDTRITGNSEYLEYDPASATTSILFFNFLGMRAITNSTAANFRASKRLTFRGGYQYSDRLIRSNEYLNILPDGPESIVAEQTNHTRSGLLGVRWQPIQPLTVNLDAEISRADRPFYPISDRNYHALSGRIQYRKKSLLLSTGYRENYNNNSIQITAYSSRARSYFADASWTARSWMAFDASYSRLHLDTIGGLAFFTSSSLAQLDQTQSVYISNIHAGNLGVRFVLRKLADLYTGYSITRDVGDGRSAPSSVVTDPVSGFLMPVQTFPLSFQSPLARVSIKINNRLRWNAGWQYYRYREDFGLITINQNYRAQTGYTSLLWSF